MTKGAPQWGTADAEIKDLLLSSKVLPFQPGAGLYIAMMLRLLPGISSLLIFTLPVRSPAFFPKPLPGFSCVSCVSCVPVWACRII